jgi:hypothetical protein
MWRVMIAWGGAPKPPSGTTKASNCDFRIAPSRRAEHGHVAAARPHLAAEHRRFYEHEPRAMPSRHAPVQQNRAARRQA